MIALKDLEKIMMTSDAECGGDNALDGFEFQVSAAIYLMFDEISNKSEFALAYEKIEDFIIFTDSINLYQAKSISNNLTPKILYTGKKTKNNASGLSIIEKMADNYMSVKEVANSINVSNTLLICHDFNFSNMLNNEDKGITKLEEICFDILSEDVKNEIISKTKYSKYPWKEIKARRLIPKPYHEDVTRTHIDTVVRNIYGENKINTAALYNALSGEIRRVRKDKILLKSDFIHREISKYTKLEDEIDYKDYSFLLSYEDSRNILIAHNFKIILINLKIPNHPHSNDLKFIMELYKKANSQTFYDFYDIFINHIDSKDIIVRLNTNEIKALILISIAKELEI